MDRPSYETINYDLRPAKSIERKMMAEALSALILFAPMKEYSYRGFGSPYFTDFALFHRLLGISRMESIEKDEYNRERFEFNRPLGCIKLRFGNSTDILPGLDWSGRTIVWLDYDGKLTHAVLSDIAIFCDRAKSGSVLTVSVNVRPEYNDRGRRQKLERRLGHRFRVPRDVTDFSLGGWGTALACRRIIYNEIQECLTRTNARLPKSEQLTYAQLFNFHYKDSAEMLTTGGIVFSEAEKAAFDKCAFEKNFDFVRPGVDAYNVEVPSLTFRELHHLNKQLPGLGTPSAHGVPKEDLEKYRKIYRYFPRLSETEFY